MEVDQPDALIATSNNVLDYNDLDNIDNQDGDQNAEEKKEEEKKKKKLNLLKFNQESIIDKDQGLKLLYKYFVIEPSQIQEGKKQSSSKKRPGNDILQLKDRGHEIGDLNRIMRVFENWHY